MTLATIDSTSSGVGQMSFRYRLAATSCADRLFVEIAVHSSGQRVGHDQGGDAR